MQKEKTVQVFFRIPLSCSWSTSAATYTFTSVDLTAANLGARAASIAPNFEFFRIRKAKMIGWTDMGGPMYDSTAVAKQGLTLGFWGMAFDPEAGSLQGTPTNQAGFCQYRHCVEGNPRHRLQISLGPGDIIGTRPFKWFSTTTTGTPAAGETSSGMIWMMTYNGQSTNNNSSVYGFMEGIVEFRGAVAPSLSKSVHAPKYEVGPRGDVHEVSAMDVEEKEQEPEEIVETPRPKTKPQLVIPRNKAP